MNREQLRAVYLDFVNNYLTAELFAEHNELYPEEAKTLLELAKRCMEYPSPEA